MLPFNYLKTVWFFSLSISGEVCAFPLNRHFNWFAKFLQGFTKF